VRRQQGRPSPELERMQRRRSEAPRGRPGISNSCGRYWSGGGGSCLEGGLGLLAVGDW